MTANEIRQTYLNFFKEKDHLIVKSAPMVVKNDPTLMFTNAGMNQFKDYFLGNSEPKSNRIANTQKCLRVSGKHNDLEEVGIDTYHHTMFEMLGNWSFGDYFKKEAIGWAWELLTRIYHIPVDRIYVTVFEGDKDEKLEFDHESYNEWGRWIDVSRILNGNKKDNFWEMGDTGPCGPCSEIHVDLRNDSDRSATEGSSLVNQGHPQVIEIWNLVFMEFNRMSDKSLVLLPNKHVDTGMGFERLCMALQNKTSNYDTDIFQPLINFISAEANAEYGKDEQMDIAMRVLSDHIRAVSFAIADGQLPSNNKAGYVIRRILRRAVRYAYTFLDFKEPFIYKLVPILAANFRGIFNELYAQQEFVKKVIFEEESSFLRTLGVGIQRFENYPEIVLSGEFVFELYDTFGFPVDLTQLLARESGKEIDMDGFHAEMSKQKIRSRADSAVDKDDWVMIRQFDSTEFMGYDQLTSHVNISKYRKTVIKDKTSFQLVFDRTPFYAESGGQVGDSGWITSGDETVMIIDTQKENDLIFHICEKLPKDPSATFDAKVNEEKRKLIMANHSATHLLHAALRKVLGSHVVQKGSLVNQDHTRFDFAHFGKLSEDELVKIESLVNQQIRENIPVDEQRNIPIDTAIEKGAMALFGEKYGDFVRMISFDPAYSVELCGGTHVKNTGSIGFFKIVSESSIATGVRRIEAITGAKAEHFVFEKFNELNKVKELVNNPSSAVKGVEIIILENSKLQGKVKSLLDDKVRSSRDRLLKNVIKHNGINLISESLEIPSSEAIKNLCFDVRAQISDLVMVIGANLDGKAHLSVIISDNLVTDKNLDASLLVRELAKEIKGGGGGQKFYATAGGSDITGINRAIEKVKSMI